jgi:hypothetical protein
LDSKAYTLTAWKTGFVGRLYNLTNPRGGMPEILQPTPTSPINGIDFSLEPEPDIAQMPDAALIEAHPHLRRDLQFQMGRFSPDGSELAFAVSGIRSGGADETWLYSLRDKRLQRIADRPAPYVWGADGKLYAWFVSDRRRYVVATSNSVSEIDQLPSDIAAELVRGWQFRDEVQRAGEYAISAENQGHGFFHLVVRSPGEVRPKVIADGSWELESFLINPTLRQVLYPVTGWFGSLITYDLRTGHSEVLDFQSGESIRLLDLTGDGKLVAYTVTGPCSENESSYQWPLHIGHRLERRPMNVCFIRPK